MSSDDTDEKNKMRLKKAIRETRNDKIRRETCDLLFQLNDLAQSNGADYIKLDMNNTLTEIQNEFHHLNTNLDIEGVLLTMYDGRLRLANQVVEEVKTHFQNMVFDTIIQRNTKLAEAPSFGKTIIMHDAIGKGSTSYLNLAREILQRNGLTKISDSDRMINIQESEEELSEDV